jgi:hypothetical protein
MCWLNIDDRFMPFVSLDQTEGRQRERLLKWLEASLFPPSLLEALRRERGGTVRSVDMIEALVKDQPKVQ